MNEWKQLTTTLGKILYLQTGQEEVTHVSSIWPWQLCVS